MFYNINACFVLFLFVNLRANINNNNMNVMIKHKLDTILEFQSKYPTSHVGGSIGLMIRGIDLKRPLFSSDLDITTDVFDANESSELEGRSDANDFDYALKRNHEDGRYTKLDIRVNPEPSFDVIEYDGNKYNVSKLRDILFWKKKYADKGVLKHQDDLVTIETGVRPDRVVEVSIFDELPF